MARLPVPGDDADIWGDILNDFLAISHLDDGRIRVEALPEPQVSDGSITPAKLSQAYVPLSTKGQANGVASLDGTGRVPIAQIPGGAVLQDATTSVKGIVQLAGDLSGSAAAPTVPGLATKYVKPAGGIPETDLDSSVQTKLNSGSVPGATTTSTGVIQLAGDLGGTSTAPTVPGLANKVNTSAVGAASGVASLDGTGKVPVAQLPAMSAADATTTSKGIVQLAGDLGGTAASPTVPGLAGKADDTSVVHKATNETVTGVKVFTSSPEVPDPTAGIQVANKQYVDAAVTGGVASDATTTSKGIVQLAGDLGGTAASPTVPGLAGKYVKPGGGIPATDLDSSVQATLSNVVDATTTNKGIVQLAGDLGGTAASPTVPGLANKINTSEKGVASGVASLDGGGKVPSSQLPVLTRLPAYSNSGALSVQAGTHRLYNDSGTAWTIASVRASVGTAPTGASAIIDVNIDGTTIFTTQANRPTIAAASNTSGKVTTMNVTSVPNGSYITVDIDQVGSTVSGSNLTVQLEVY